MRAALLAAATIASGLPALAQPAQPRAYALPPTFNADVARVPPRACVEGRTRDGRCVNPVAAQLGRQTAVAATQSKLSMSAGPPASPSYDPYFRYPNAVYFDVKRELDMQLGRRSSSYVPAPYHGHAGPGTPFPHAYPVPRPIYIYTPPRCLTCR